MWSLLVVSHAHWLTLLPAMVEVIFPQFLSDGGIGRLLVESNRNSVWEASSEDGISFLRPISNTGQRATMATAPFCPPRYVRPYGLPSLFFP
ncbi:unnamed protein product [Victoria cruziana]